MKKIITIFTIVALTASVSFAQFNAKAGLNMANVVSNNEDVKNAMQLGMIIGGSYAVEISDAMNFNISATFKQSGTKETNDFLGGSSSTTYSLNYLDISPNLAFNVSDVMSISFGPYIAFAISGKIASKETITNGPTVETSEPIEFGEITIENSIDGTGPDGISAMDFGINIGATFFVNDVMNVSAGYALGLANLFSIEKDLEDLITASGDEIPSLKNSGIFLTLAYSFGD